MKRGKADSNRRNSGRFDAHDQSAPEHDQCGFDLFEPRFVMDVEQPFDVFWRNTEPTRQLHFVDDCAPHCSEYLGFGGDERCQPRERPPSRRRHFGQLPAPGHVVGDHRLKEVNGLRQRSSQFSPRVTAMPKSGKVTT